MDFLIQCTGSTLTSSKFQFVWREPGHVSLRPRAISWVPAVLRKPHSLHVAQERVGRSGTAEECWSAIPGPDHSLAEHLVGVLNRTGLDHDVERLHLHSALVDIGGAGILCGPSGAGKTTIAAGLVERGCRYLTDETVPISAGSATIETYPKPLTLKGLVPSSLRPLEETGRREGGGACLYVWRGHRRDDSVPYCLSEI